MIITMRGLEFRGEKNINQATDIEIISLNLKIRKNVKDKK